MSSEVTPATLNNVSPAGSERARGIASPIVLKRRVLPAILPLVILASGVAHGEHNSESMPLYTYTLSSDGTAEAYDEAMVAACLQGLMNRQAPLTAILSESDDIAAYWLDKFTSNGHWLHGRERRPVPDLEAFFDLAADRVRGAIIWDPSVPASVNVATTIAGVEDGIVLSPEFADRYLEKWGLAVIRDLRGQFTGEETGSKKNDAYRWAIREYLSRGRCSGKVLCFYQDSFSDREKGVIRDVANRDWAVQQRAFVYDLFPWGDETPVDDPDQKLGTDLETYHLMLGEILKQTTGRNMTEVVGYWPANKYRHRDSAHDGVPTEWEMIHLITPYNCFQNLTRGCYNKTLHSQAPRGPQKQNRSRPARLEDDKTYLCILMADYDSSHSLYRRLPDNWNDPRRGALPLVWGINPNLVDTYPDVIEYLYATQTPNDYFGADASVAGYMNPNRIQQKYLPLFVRHNRYYYQLLDMSFSPMVLDFHEPSAEVKDAFTQFSPDGMATIVMNLHDPELLQEVKGNKVPAPHILTGPRVWKGMPIIELLDAACYYRSPDHASDAMSGAIASRPPGQPGFYFFRIVWRTPGNVIDAVELLKTKRPDLDIEVLDPYNFFGLYKEYHLKGNASRP